MNAAMPLNLENRPDQLLAQADVCALLRISDTHLGKLVREKGFPQPAYQLCARGRRWRLADVQAWLEARKLHPAA